MRGRCEVCGRTSGLSLLTADRDTTMDDDGRRGTTLACVACACPSGALPSHIPHVPNSSASEYVIWCVTAGQTAASVQSEEERSKTSSLPTAIACSLACRLTPKLNIIPAARKPLVEPREKRCKESHQLCTHRCQFWFHARPFCPRNRFAPASRS